MSAAQSVSDWCAIWFCITGSYRDPWRMAAASIRGPCHQLTRWPVLSANGWLSPVIRASTTSVGLIDGIDHSRSQVRLSVSGVGDPLPPTIRMPGEPRLIGRAVTVGWFALRKLRPALIANVREHPAETGDLHSNL
jgi:hypothetical protein